MDKRAVVFAPFFSADLPASRPRFVASVLAELMPVDVVTSDFDHGEKAKREHRPVKPFEQVVYLKTRPYRSNVSAARLVSHLLFAFTAAAYFRRTRDKYDVVYATAPLNVLTWLVFTLAGSKTKIIDVVDIWPDVLPFPPLVRRVLRPMFAVWKWFFRSAVGKADVVMAVSDEFLKEAAAYAKDAAQTRRFYIGHDRLVSAVPKQPIFTIAYVGNLGRLYDFGTLVEVLSEDQIQNSVQLFVVGHGDRQEWLTSELRQRNIRHHFFGTVYDPCCLAEILRSCHVGFNGYINTTAAFSYKANTYFAAGLPVLNSMAGDLQRLVAEHQLGENYLGGNRQQLRECILRLQGKGTTEMAANCERFFASQLDSAAIRSELKTFFAENFGACRERAGDVAVVNS